MATGYDIEEVLAIGDRIASLRVAFNLREGVRNATFRLPPRVVGNPPLQAGATKGVTVAVDVQQKEYFEEMGWSPAGVPSAARTHQSGWSLAVRVPNQKQKYATASMPAARHCSTSRPAMSQCGFGCFTPTAVS